MSVVHQAVFRVQFAVDNCGRGGACQTSHGRRQLPGGLPHHGGQGRVEFIVRKPRQPTFQSAETALDEIPLVLRVDRMRAEPRLGFRRQTVQPTQACGQSLPVHRIVDVHRAPRTPPVYQHLARQPLGVAVEHQRFRRQVRPPGQCLGIVLAPPAGLACIQEHLQHQAVRVGLHLPQGIAVAGQRVRELDGPAVHRACRGMGQPMQGIPDRTGCGSHGVWRCGLTGGVPVRRVGHRDRAGPGSSAACRGPVASKSSPDGTGGRGSACCGGARP